MKIVEIKPSKKPGNFNRNDVDLKTHEMKTIDFLIGYGFNIEAIIPAYTPKNKNPDILLNGAVWEMKSPEGNGKYTIQRQVHEAGSQSNKLILDLRRIKKPADKAQSEAVFHFGHSKSIRRLLIITKDKKLLEIIK